MVLCVFQLFSLSRNRRFWRVCSSEHSVQNKTLFSLDRFIDSETKTKSQSEYKTMPSSLQYVVHIVKLPGCLLGMTSEMK